MTDLEIVQQYSQPSVHRWLKRALIDWTLIVITFYLADKSNHILGYWVASLFIGTRQHSLALLAHDGAHRTISRNRRLNDLLTQAFTFWPMGMGLAAYRRMHFKHHQCLGTTKDPELLQKNFLTPDFDVPFKATSLWFCLIKDLCGLGFFSAFNVIRTSPPVAKDLKGIIPTSLMAASVLLWFGHWEVFAVWYWSIGTSLWASFRVRTWIEHMATTKTQRVKANWWQKILFCPQNADFHYEHHKWPSVPCWNLPKARLQDEGTPIMTVKELFHFLRTVSETKSGDVPNSLDSMRVSR